MCLLFSLAPRFQNLQVRVHVVDHLSQNPSNINGVHRQHVVIFHELAVAEDGLDDVLTIIKICIFIIVAVNRGRFHRARAERQHLQLLDARDALVRVENETAQVGLATVLSCLWISGVLHLHPILVLFILLLLVLVARPFSEHAHVSLLLLLSRNHRVRNPCDRRTPRVPARRPQNNRIFDSFFRTRVQEQPSQKLKCHVLEREGGAVEKFENLDVTSQCRGVCTTSRSAADCALPPPGYVRL